MIRVLVKATAIKDSTATIDSREDVASCTGFTHWVMRNGKNVAGFSNAAEARKYRDTLNATP